MSLGLVATDVRGVNAFVRKSGIHMSCVLLQKTEGRSSF
jgi:hypothetical protein